MTVANQYRTFWRRFWAGTIDGVILSPLTLLDGWIWNHHSSSIARGLLLVLSSLAWYAYPIYLHGRFGQTFGKRLMRIKVVDLSGQALSMTQAFRRELLNFPIGAWSLLAELPLILRGGNPYDPVQLHGGPPAALSLGLLALEVVSTLGNPQRRALHDFVAGSLVVKLSVSDRSDTPNADDSTVENMPPGKFPCFACGSPVSLGASSCRTCEASFVYRHGRPEPATRD